MKRKKDSSALFELMSLSSKGVSDEPEAVDASDAPAQPVPPQREKESAPSAGPAMPPEPPGETPAPAPPRRPRPTAAPPAPRPERSEPRATSPTTPPAGEPATAGESGRLTLSLGYPSVAVAGLGLVVVLLAAFWLGRLSVSASNGPAADGPAQASMWPAGDQNPVAGKRYLVVEALPNTETNQAVADQIVAFLAERGEPARKYPDDESLYIVSLRGFDRVDQRAREYANYVHQQLGEAYFARFGAHKFRAPDNNNNWPWFVAGGG